MTATTGSLRCRGLTKRFAAETAVVDLDLDVEPGEIVALIGLNGAGKTTLMRLALGMTRPDGGEVQILGHHVGTAGQQPWRHVGHMIETPFAYPELTVAENLWVAARLHGVPRRHAHTAAARAIEKLALEAYAHRRSAALSMGNRQRLGLASAILHEPLLLVLDEPTNSLDPYGVVLLRDLVQEAAHRGTAVLVSSHHLDEVARIADRVEVIHRGALVGELPPRGRDLEHAFFEMVHSADLRAAATARPSPRGAAS